MEINEEWNNFMHRISEVSSIVRDLASDDKAKSEAANILATKYLKEEDQVLDVEGMKIRVKTDRTVINEKAFKNMDKKSDPDQMDPEVWMSEMSKDAEKRYQERKVRKEKADTLKTQAIKSFRRGEFNRALSCYNRAIEQVKDSPLLYTDRALTLIKLGKYEKVLQDCDWALRINENSFKARLYKAKAHQELDQLEQQEAIKKELDEKFPEHRDLIEYFLNKGEELGSGDQ